MARVIRDGFKPMYSQISSILRQRIEGGALKPGDRICSEREIMQEFGVSRNTAQQAIEELVRDGLACRVQGKGTFVAERKVRYGLQRLTSFSEEIRLRGMVPSSRLIALAKEPPSPRLAQLLRLGEGEPVVRLERLRLADGQPMALHTSYVPEGLCPGIDRFNFDEASLFEVIEGHYGLHISRAEQTIKPAIARHDEARWLAVSVGVPLLLVEGVAYLENGVPIEANRILYRCDVYEFTVHSSRTPDLLSKGLDR